MTNDGSITRRKIRPALARYLTSWVHFRNRLLDRHHIKISEEEYKKLCKDIRDGKMEQCFVGRENNDSKIYNIVIHGALVKVVFKVKEKLLVTALPK